MYFDSRKVQNRYWTASCFQYIKMFYSQFDLLHYFMNLSNLNQIRTWYQNYLWWKYDIDIEFFSQCQSFFSDVLNTVETHKMICFHNNVDMLLNCRICYTYEHMIYVLKVYNLSKKWKWCKYISFSYRYLLWASIELHKFIKNNKL